MADKLFSETNGKKLTPYLIGDTTDLNVGGVPLYTDEFGGVWQKAGYMETDASKYPDAAALPYGGFGSAVEVVNNWSYNVGIYGGLKWNQDRFYFVTPSGGSVYSVVDTFDVYGTTATLSENTLGYLYGIHFGGTAKMPLVFLLGKPQGSNNFAIQTMELAHPTYFRFKAVTSTILPVSIGTSPVGLIERNGYFYTVGNLTDGNFLLELNGSGDRTGKKFKLYGNAESLLLDPVTLNIWIGYSGGQNNDKLVEHDGETLQPTGWRLSGEPNDPRYGFDDKGRVFTTEYNGSPRAVYHYERAVGVGLPNAAIDEDTNLPIYVKVK